MSPSFKFFLTYKPNDGSSNSIYFADPFIDYPTTPVTVTMTYYDSTAISSATGIFTDGTNFEVVNPGSDKIASAIFGDGTIFQYNTTYTTEDGNAIQVNLFPLLLYPIGNVKAIMTYANGYPTATQIGSFTDGTIFSVYSPGADSIITITFEPPTVFEYNVPYPVNDFDTTGIYFSEPFGNYPTTPIEVTITFINDLAPPYTAIGTFSSSTTFNFPWDGRNVVQSATFFPASNLKFGMTWFFSP